MEEEKMEMEMKEERMKEKETLHLLPWGKGTNVRLVRCPKCDRILPHLDIPAYQCGGCGAILKGKQWKPSLPKSFTEGSTIDEEYWPRFDPFLQSTTDEEYSLASLVVGEDESEPLYKEEVPKENPSSGDLTQQHQWKQYQLPHQQELTCFRCKLSVIPNECYDHVPQTVRQAIVDPDHDLTLISTPSAKASSLSKCEACGGVPVGFGFSYNCPKCATHYHPHCLNIPKPLICEVCHNPAFDKWLYRCDACGFDVELLGSVTSNTNPGTESQLQNQSESQSEAITILKETISVADCPSTSSPRINPEVEVGISCGNVIAPHIMMGVFQNHIEQQDIQVSGDANLQTHSDSHILQVSTENGTGAVVTAKAIERKMDGIEKVPDSTNPRIEPKARTGRCCWFRCFCHCGVGPME